MRRRAQVWFAALAVLAMTSCHSSKPRTLSLLVWEGYARLRRGMTPEINAISTIIFIFSLVTIVVWYRLRMRGETALESAF